MSASTKVQVAGLMKALHVRDALAHPLGLLRGKALGGERGRAGLHHAAYLDQSRRDLFGRVAVRGRLEDRVQARPVVRGIDEGSPAGLHIEDVLCPERLEGFAHGQPADAVGLGDVGFGGIMPWGWSFPSRISFSRASTRSSTSVLRPIPVPTFNRGSCCHPHYPSPAGGPACVARPSLPRRSLSEYVAE